MKLPIQYRTAVLQALLVAPGVPSDLASRISTVSGGHLPPHRIHGALTGLLADRYIARGDYVSPSVRAYTLTPEGRCIAERDRAIFLGLARLTTASVDEPRPHEPSRKVTCSACNTAQWLTQRGTLQQHRRADGSTCEGSCTSADAWLFAEVHRLYAQSMTQSDIAERLGLTQREVSACLARAGTRTRKGGRQTRASSTRNVALRLLAEGPCDLAELNRRIELETGRRRAVSTLHCAVRGLVDDGLVAHVDTSANRTHVFALVDPTEKSKPC